MKIYDITLRITNGMAVYPGDAAPVVDGIPPDRHLAIGPHCGTHVDAPRHLAPGGLKLSDIPISTFVGPCLLIDVSAETRAGRTVTAAMLKRIGPIRASIVLIKTNNSIDHICESRFASDYTVLSGEAADLLAAHGVRAVGFDYLSVDPVGDPARPAHEALLGRGICVIEGLDLSEPAEGEYFLACLPLKLADADGAPARAILIEKETMKGIFG